MLRPFSERMLRLLQGMQMCPMLVWMVMVMVMVMVDGELRQSNRVYVLVREVMLHPGEPQGVVEEVLVMELVVVGVVGPKRRERRRHEDWGRRHRKQVCARCRTPWPTRHCPHRGPPSLRVLEVPEIIL